MVSIYEAYYIENGKQELININNITVADYVDRYKGNLYCTMPNCSAKLSYVSRENHSDHFRTWRESPHVETCLYFFEKIKTREGRRIAGETTGIVSDERIKRSLLEAFALEMMSEEQRKLMREKEREKRKRRARNKIRGSEEATPAQRIISNPKDIDENTQSGGFRLYKKGADALSEKDIGETRTVTGKLKRIKIEGSKNVLIEIEKNTKKVEIMFEEAFFAANNRYTGMFHFIERYLNDYGELLFSATGEVRKNKKNERYEVVVFNSVGFLIHGKNLESIATEYAMEDNG